LAAAQKVLNKSRMKTIAKILSTIFLAAAVCASLNLNIARADDGKRGGDIDGSEHLDVDLQMTPTASAPAGSSISLELKADDDDGTTEAELKLDARGLSAGTYSVSVTLKSDGSTVALGTFSVNSQGEGEVEFATNPEDSEEVPFPANFNPMDIATVSVANAGNVVLFTADLTNVKTASAMTLNATVNGHPGSTDPNASGTATLTANSSRSGPKGQVQLMGSGFPIRTQLTTFVNNSVVSKKARTDNNGAFNFNFGPKGKASTVAPGITLFQITSITLKDSAGNVLMTFSF
jgi:hypothetical protein